MKHRKKNLKQYVKYGLKKGKSKEELTKILGEYDYSELDVDSMFDNLSSKKSRNRLLKAGILTSLLIIALSLALIKISSVFDSSPTTMAVIELVFALL